jgi:predicted transcriptional regulator
VPQQKTRLRNLTVYIPQEKQKSDPVGRLAKLGAKQDRSVNYLVVEAIMEYLEREEGRG